MAKNTVGYFLADQSYTQTSITNTTLTTIVTGNTDDSWVYEILITSTCTQAVTGTLYINVGGADFPIKKILAANPILANQGTATANPYRLIQPADGGQVMYRLLDRDQNYYIPLKSGQTLKFQVDGGLINGAINILVIERDF